jgi:hypothetical protein
VIPDRWVQFTRPLSDLYSIQGMDRSQGESSCQGCVRTGSRGEISPHVRADSPVATNLPDPGVTRLWPRSMALSSLGLVNIFQVNQVVQAFFQYTHRRKPDEVGAECKALAEQSCRNDLRNVTCEVKSGISTHPASEPGGQTRPRHNAARAETYTEDAAPINS